MMSKMTQSDSICMHKWLSTIRAYLAFTNMPLLIMFNTYFKHKPYQLQMKSISIKKNFTSPSNEGFINHKVTTYPYEISHISYFQTNGSLQGLLPRTHLHKLSIWLLDKDLWYAERLTSLIHVICIKLFCQNIRLDNASVF